MKVLLLVWLNHVRLYDFFLGHKVYLGVNIETLIPYLFPVYKKASICRIDIVDHPSPFPTLLVPREGPSSITL